MNHLCLVLERKLFFPAILLFLGPTSVAFASENPWFVEVAFVASELDDPINNNLSSVFDTGITQISLDTNGFDDDDSASVSVGYYIGANWGVELSWFQLDNFETLTLGSIPQFPFGGRGGGSVFSNHEINIEGFDLGVFREYQIGNRFSLKGKLGIFAYNHKLNTIRGRVAQPEGVPISVPNENWPLSPSGSDFFFGPSADQRETFYLPTSFASPIEDIEKSGGVTFSAAFGTNYKLTDNLSLFFEYQIIDSIEDSRSNALLAGVQVRF